jgi:hypothetical protein
VGNSRTVNVRGSALAAAVCCFIATGCVTTRYVPLARASRESCGGTPLEQASIRVLVVTQADVPDPITGVVIALRARGRPVSEARTFTSDRNGEVRAAVPPGTYTLTTDVSGFHRVGVRDIVLKDGCVVEVRLVLEVSGETDS